jgi:hypothetical protein
MNTKKLGLWMDQSKAILIGFENNVSTLLEEIESPIESMVREPGEGSNITRFSPTQGASNNEKKGNNIQRNQSKHYFNELGKKLKGAEELYLIGPGIIKDQFFKQIASDKNFSTLKIKVESADKMTTNQLLALVKGHFAEKK